MQPNFTAKQNVGMHITIRFQKAICLIKIVFDTVQKKKTHLIVILFYKWNKNH